MTRRLYTTDRLADYDTSDLGTLFGMAHHDTLCTGSVYLGMTRSATVATAWRSCADIATTLHNRSVAGDALAGAILHDLKAMINAIPNASFAG